MLLVPKVCEVSQAIRVHKDSKEELAHKVTLDSQVTEVSRVRRVRLVIKDSRAEPVLQVIRVSKEIRAGLALPVHKGSKATQDSRVSRVQQALQVHRAELVHRVIQVNGVYRV